MGVVLEVADPALRLDLSANSEEEILDRMALLANSEGALDLRIGEMLATLDAGEKRRLGHTSFRTLAKEEVDGDRSWATKRKNFAASDLVAIKIAVCRNLVPISMAVEAPRDLTLEEQIEWVAGVRSGEIRRRTKSAHHPRVDVDDPADAAMLHDARRLARTVKGGNCSDRVADLHMLDAWRRKADGRELVRKAMEPKDPLPAPPPIDWSQTIDPAAEVLGPREIPTDEHDALRIFRELQRQKRMRTLELGRLFGQVVERKLYRRWGYDTVEQMVKKSFALSVRTLQNYRDRARDLAIYPELLDALEAGMNSARVQLVYEVATEETVGRWLAVARRTTVVELERAVAWAHETVGDAALESYEHAMGQTKSAHHWVALRAARRPTPPPNRIEGVHPDLLEAARWYLANVRIPKQHGFQEVKEREHWTCENPLCYCLTLSCEGHHKKWRSRGGTDEKGNGASVCRTCHLRGIHANEIIQLEVDDRGRDVWSFAHGLQIVVF